MCKALKELKKFGPKAKLFCVIIVLVPVFIVILFIPTEDRDSIAMFFEISVSAMVIFIGTLILTVVGMFNAYDSQESNEKYFNDLSTLWEERNKKAITRTELSALLEEHNKKAITRTELSALLEEHNKEAITKTELSALLEKHNKEAITKTELSALLEKHKNKLIANINNK